MSAHCAECGKRLSPVGVHRCSECGMKYCRAHVHDHDCEPDSREGLLTWATGLGPGPQREERGSLPSGATYRAVSSAQLYRVDLAERGLLWLFGIASIVVSLTGFIALGPDLTISAIALGALCAAAGAMLLARTFQRMHALSRFAAFAIALVFLSIPALIALLLV